VFTFAKHTHVNERVGDNANIEGKTNIMHYCQHYSNLSARKASVMAIPLVPVAPTTHIKPF